MITLAACTLPHTDSASKTPASTHTKSPHNLIVYYDDQENIQPILKAAEKIHAKILYRYKNFNALAVALPNNYTQQQGVAYFEALPNVLQAIPDQIQPLY